MPIAPSQDSISAVRVVPVGGLLAVSWESSDPPGAAYQVYVGRRLAWSGTARSAALEMPPSRMEVDVLRVDPSQVDDDLSTHLAEPTLRDRATISWVGGPNLGEVADYAIFASTAPGGSVSYAAPAAVVPVEVDPGFGSGGFGTGTFGRATAEYSWTSGPLASGTWTFAVAARDRLGNRQSSPPTQSVVISLPPRPPAAYADGSRLRYAFSGGNVTLTWQASPA